MKLNKIIIAMCLLTFKVSLSFSAELTNVTADDSNYLDSKSKLIQIAKSLDMTPQQYLKFYSAVLGLEKAEKLGPGFAIEAHPAFIQFKQYLTHGERASNVLLDELEGVYTEYRTGLAHYSELTLEEFAVAERKLAIIDKSLVDLRKESQSATVNEDDDSVVIVVIRDEDELEESASGDFETTAEVHSLTQPFLEGPAIDIVVNYVDHQGQFLGSQPWRVTNSFAAPLGNIQGGALVPL